MGSFVLVESLKCTGSPARSNRTIYKISRSSLRSLVFFIFRIPEGERTRCSFPRGVEWDETVDEERDVSVSLRILISFLIRASKEKRSQERKEEGDLDGESTAPVCLDVTRMDFHGRHWAKMITPLQRVSDNPTFSHASLSFVRLWISTFASHLLDAIMVIDFFKFFKNYSFKHSSSLLFIEFFKFQVKLSKLNSIRWLIGRFPKISKKMKMKK